MKKYLLLATKPLGAFLGGILLTFILWEGYYYYQVLRWVDAIRIQQAIEQVAAQAKSKVP